MAKKVMIAASLVSSKLLMLKNTSGKLGTKNRLERLYIRFALLVVIPEQGNRASIALHVKAQGHNRGLGLAAQGADIPTGRHSAAKPGLHQRRKRGAGGLAGIGQGVLHSVGNSIGQGLCGGIIIG